MASIPDLHIEQLGPATVDTPLCRHEYFRAGAARFVSDRDRVLYDIHPPEAPVDPAALPAFERAGPRHKIFFDSKQTSAAIVTCGGLCPGLNDVIRTLVLELHYWYNVDRVYGIRYGYAGLDPQTDCPPIEMNPDLVSNIHLNGGTLLGSSRGCPSVAKMVDTLVARNIDILFCIGGDGTLRGAHEIAMEIKERALPIVVVSIPKTIDNDIELVYRSFGFDTAVAEAEKVLDCAHVESLGARGGVGLVKLMGRDSGFIAAEATLASGDVNYCLIPEVPSRLEGEDGLLQHLRVRLASRRHAVIVVAEGAGQHLMGPSDACDASGNVLLADIGVYLKNKITEAFAQSGDEVHVKYFDPSYIIRSVRANSSDSVFCADLARCAVHAAMAGKTDLLIGQWHGVFTHVPLTAVINRRKKVDPSGSLWRSALTTTGQPDFQ